MINKSYYCVTEKKEKKKKESEKLHAALRFALVFVTPTLRSMSSIFLFPARPDFQFPRKKQHSQ